MSPTIHREGPYRFYFNSREENRAHVHVETAEGKAKFWLEPLVSLADYHGLKQHQLKEMQRLVEKYEEKFKNDWNKHFTG